MNLKNIIQEIESTDAKVFDRVTERRQALKDFGTKLVAASLPLAFASAFNKTYAQTGGAATTTLINTLNYLLELEFFEFNYFHIGNSVGNLVPVADQSSLQEIEAHDLGHLTFLRNLINTLGGTPFTPNYYTGNSLTGNPYSPNSYDFTAGGTYRIYNIYPGENNYPNFILLGQVIKDTMVRAYQGQIPNLFPNTNSSLASVMQILSTQGRHAAHIRIIRRFEPAPENPKPWVTNNIPPTTAFIANYSGEQNVLQNGINITELTDPNGVAFSQTAATEAFDEPLDQTTTLSLLSPFILA